MWAFENKLRSFVSAGDFVRGYLRFARFFNVNVRQLAVNERQCFLCGLWCEMVVNGFSTASCGNGRQWRATHAVGNCE